MLSGFSASLVLQDTLMYTGQMEQGADQISFHPSDSSLLCTLGAGGLSLWSIDTLRGQDQIRQIPIQMPGEAR